MVVNYYFGLYLIVFYVSFVIGMEGLSITMGRSRLWWYTGAQVTTGQSVEAGYSVVQQVSKSYFDVRGTQRV